MRTILGRFHAEALTLTANTVTPLLGVGAGRPNDTRKSLLVKNGTGAVLYLGGAGVDVTQGYPLDPAESFPADAVGGLYALSVAGGAVQILEGF